MFNCIIMTPLHIDKSLCVFILFFHVLHLSFRRLKAYFLKRVIGKVK